MTTLTPGARRGRQRSDLRMLALALLIAAAPLGSMAHAGSAAEVGQAGLNSCRANAGKPLYDCVANVLDRMSSSLDQRAPAEARSALQSAASQLRAATNKAQALSAIAQCRSVFSGIIQRWKAEGKTTTGFSAIAGVLARAAQMIQAKG
ncbi:hypothetical protein IVA79_32755 [Bradyrhizobium sp. 138]|uniref:hypothetical protein n=1 Tax=Bradyrhizobium sp. 138 TaxID=2782615 RepID=UPI001FFB89DA|nr:hypothetical protein [Bradyrhizobium sp. 138]MCK1738612.1 hypothetical protein [Bradyrhizobium sp. 138]